MYRSEVVTRGVLNGKQFLANLCAVEHIELYLMSCDMLRFT